MILVKNFNFFSKSLDEYLEHPLISELYSEMYPYDIDAWPIFYDAHYLCTWIYNQEHPEVDYHRKIENILADFEKKSAPDYVLATVYSMLMYIDEYNPCCYPVTRFMKCLNEYMRQHQMSCPRVKFENIAKRVILETAGRAKSFSQSDYFDVFTQFDLDIYYASGYIFEKEIVEKVISGYSPDRIKEALECFCYNKEKAHFAELIIEYCPRVEYLDIIEKVLHDYFPKIGLHDKIELKKNRILLNCKITTDHTIKRDMDLIQWLQENREQKLEAQEKAYKNSESKKIRELDQTIQDLKKQLEAKNAECQTLQNQTREVDEFTTYVTYGNVVTEIAKCDSKDDREKYITFFRILLPKMNTTKFKKDINKKIKELKKEIEEEEETPRIGLIRANQVVIDSKDVKYQ